MNWYINRKTNELVQGKLIDEHILSIRIDDYWELKDASQYDEAMICPEYKTCTQDCCDSHNEPHIKQERCSLTFCETDNGCEIYCPCIPYIPKQKQADEEPVFPVCGTCNAQKEQELSDNELQEPKAGAIEMLLEATNPNCKEKPDSSLLLSEMKAVEKAIELQKYSEDEGYVLMPADYYKAGMVAELDHLAKLGIVYVKNTVCDKKGHIRYKEYIPISDYRKGEGK